jgi:hypothetical protein
VLKKRDKKTEALEEVKKRTEEVGAVAFEAEIPLYVGTMGVNGRVRVSEVRNRTELPAIADEGLRGASDAGEGEQVQANRQGPEGQARRQGEAE